MATITYYDGNQGVNFLRDFYSYDFEDDGSGVFTITYGDYAEEQFGTFDPGRYAFSYTLTTVGGVSELPDDPDASEGEVDFLAGSLTEIQAFDQSGNLIWEMTGLNTSLVLLGAYGNSEEEWAAGQLIYSGAHTITGSVDSMNTNDGWDGDDIRTGWGNDTVEAKGGDDFISDKGGADTYKGGKGSDTLSYSSWFYDPHLVSQGVNVDLAAGTAVGPDGHTDLLFSIERVRGTFLDDVLSGDGDTNHFAGMQGDDLIMGKGGFDVVDYRKDADQGGRFGARVDLGDETGRDGFGTNDTLKSIEAVRGTKFKDNIRDSKKDNYLQGNDGNDILKVAKGDDTLEGGEGADRFLFIGNSFADDVIVDFEDGTDLIRIINAAEFDDLTIVQNGSSAEIQWNGNTIELHDTTAADLTEVDFIF